MTALFILFPLIVIGLPALAFVCIERPAYFRRETPVRKQLVEMLEALAEPHEIDCWEREKIGFNFSGYGTWVHKDSGVTVDEGYSSFSLKTKGGTERYDAGSHGYRVMKRLARDIRERDKRLSELAALKGMNDSFRKMHKVN